VIDCFTDNLISIKPLDEKIYIFTDYILDTYILPESSFSPSLWAEYSTTIRTTNSCEAFHSKLNAMFYNAYPNIFQFINTLKRLQTDIYIKQRNSTHLKNRTTSIINKEQFLKQAMADFQSKKISRFEFIKTLSFTFFQYHNIFYYRLYLSIF